MQEIKNNINGRAKFLTGYLANHSVSVCPSMPVDLRQQR